MAYKSWVAGELLTSADVNGYLMKQTVIVCTSGTRPSSPPEGMTVYETDTDRYSCYNGTAWVTMGQMISSQFTPTLTAATTNPQMGTGAWANAKYTLWGGKWCTYRGTLRFGTTGTITAGSGQYLISLPVATGTSVGAGVDAMGAGLVFDNSASNVTQATYYVAGTGTTTMAAFANNAQVTSSSPWVWAASDYLSWTITYETA